MLKKDFNIVTEYTYTPAPEKAPKVEVEEVSVAGKKGGKTSARKPAGKEPPKPAEPEK
jgi:hypothetical protein